MTTTSTFADVSCASLPAEFLAILAEVRDLPGIEVAQAGGRAWVRWEAGDERVLRRVLPVPGVELYRQHDVYWYRHGRHLPAFDFPRELSYRPLHQALTPAPAVPVPAAPLDLQPVLLTLAPDQRPRTVTALRCPPAALAAWADTVPAGRLAALQAGRSHSQLLLLGPRLPLLASGERFWGDRLLLPLGYRTEPDLPAGAVREALGVSEEELLLLTAGGAEAVPLAVLRPLTRAQLRLALRGAES